MTTQPQNADELRREENPTAPTESTHTTHMRVGHRRRTLRRAARRNMILRFLRAYDTLGAGMQASGINWPTVKGMMRSADFRAALWAIRTIQRAHRKDRNKARNSDLVRNLTAAGLSRALAMAECRRTHRRWICPKCGEKTHGTWCERCGAMQTMEQMQ